MHIITRLIVGGAQENTLCTADHLDKDKYDVDVVTGIQTGSEGSLFGHAANKKIRLRVEPFLVREINPFKDLIAFFRLFKFIKQNRYRIVHTHSSKAGIIGRLAAWFAGVPVTIHTVHGWGFNAYQNRLMQCVYIVLERLLLKVTDQLIVVTRKDIEKGINAGIGAEENYTLIRSGIDLNVFENPEKTSQQVRNELQIPDDAPVVGMVSRLSMQKAPWLFIETAARVVQKIPDCHFVIVGDGPLKKDIICLADKHKLNGRLILTGIRKDVAEMMNCFDVFTLFSLWEGLPRVLPQAMAVGVPIVASAIDGNAEIIENRENGLLVDPGDLEAMSRAVIDLLQDGELSQTLITAGKKAIQEYDAREMVAKISRLYENCLAQ